MNLLVAQVGEVFTVVLVPGWALSLIGNLVLVLARSSKKASGIELELDLHRTKLALGEAKGELDGELRRTRRELSSARGDLASAEEDLEEADRELDQFHKNDAHTKAVARTNRVIVDTLQEITRITETIATIGAEKTADSLGEVLVEFERKVKVDRPETDTLVEGLRSALANLIRHLAEMEKGGGSCATKDDSPPE